MMKNLQFILLQIFCLSSVFSCTFLSADKPEAGYSRYSPEEQATFLFQFDYPSTWRFDKGIPLYLFFVDPKKETLEPEYEYSNDAGLITLSRILEYSSLEEYVNDFIQEIKARSGGVFLSKNILSTEQVTIDSRPAYHIITRVDPSYGEITYDFNRLEDTYIFENNSRIYEISLLIPESDRQNEFGQGFDYLIASIRFKEEK